MCLCVSWHYIKPFIWYERTPRVLFPCLINYTVLSHSPRSHLPWLSNVKKYFFMFQLQLLSMSSMHVCTHTVAFYFVGFQMKNWNNHDKRKRKNMTTSMGQCSHNFEDDYKKRLRLIVSCTSSGHDDDDDDDDKLSCVITIILCNSYWLQSSLWSSQARGKLIIGS